MWLKPQKGPNGYRDASFGEGTVTIGQTMRPVEVREKQKQKMDKILWESAYMLGVAGKGWSKRKSTIFCQLGLLADVIIWTKNGSNRIIGFPVVTISSSGLSVGDPY